MKNVLIIGCGDIGHRVAAIEQGEGNRVAALARSDKSARSLKDQNIEPIRGDLDNPRSLQGLQTKGTLLYYFAPPPPGGTTDPRMEAFVSALQPPGLPERVALISTTGVYGDCGGAWITENRRPNPQSDRARRRLDAENTLLRWSEATGVPVVVLRVAGIYGPGRLPEKRLRSGEPVLREDDSPWSNRIHADDLARTCFAAARTGRLGATYNVSDGHPSTMTDYFFRVADLLGIPRPPTITMEEARRLLSPGMLSYLAESKRIDNRRMREELGIEPLYPTLESGLPSCIAPHAVHWVASATD